MPEIAEDEIPFEIPESWEWTRLGNIISLLSGTDFKPEEYNDRGIGTVYITGASNIDESGVIVSRWTEKPRNIAHQGDVLLTCKGTCGKTVICNIKEAHIARQIMSIKKMENLDMKFIKYFLDANFVYLKSKEQGLIPGIDRNVILNMMFSLPPLAEQKRIVAKIEEILPYIEQYGKAHTKLEIFNKKFPEDMKKSILQLAIIVLSGYFYIYRVAARSLYIIWIICKKAAHK